MGSFRVEVAERGGDPRSGSATRAAATLGYPHLTIEVSDLYLTDRALDDVGMAPVRTLIVDPTLQHVVADRAPSDGTHIVDVMPRHGVTDSFGEAVERAAAWTGHRVTASVGRRYVVRGVRSPGELDRVIRKLLANPVIERWTVDRPITSTGTVEAGGAGIETVEIAGTDDDTLLVLNAERGLSLDLDQLRAIRDHFAALGRQPTDAEVEMIAQTWSEHCAHTTFRATLRLADGTTLTPLLDQLRDCTEGLSRPWVVNAFAGNAGIVAYTADRTIALKAETHNHPSAVEPFGGANTGVGGVIRDVMGAAHRPIAVTDVLCFGPQDLTDTPEGVLHPTRIADGVVSGVADYGNKIGLPTVAGAVLYDPGYTANPLVYAGCIGVAPTSAPVLDGPHPGDRVVVLGGRTGRDGIRGATFSSRTMDAATGEVAGASVQIGDPIIEKLLIDVLDESTGLFSAITDCGAGGLSSAIGEMAEGIGASVDLAGAPLKYPGLAPWEIWLSEAQERMVLAVPPEHLAALQTACDRHGVELTDLGTFTGDGHLVVRHGERTLVDLDTAFLHDGRPPRTMDAEWPTPDRGDPASTPLGLGTLDLGGTLLALLAHPNIASKADVIHRYDHEIRGATVQRPLTGVEGDGHADGVVLVEPGDHHGIAIGIGVNPWYGQLDPERMAHAAVDEAIRNVVVAGADPDKVALLDNFSWGDPRRASTLGELAAAVRGCCDAAAAHNAPFVSGKDSLNNEYLGSDGQRHAVPPTLVITAVAHVPDPDRVLSPDLNTAGNYLVTIGGSERYLGGSHLHLLHGETGGVVPAPDAGSPTRTRTLHRAIGGGHLVACHDISEGGLAVAVAEMCIGGRLGAHLETTDALALFGEANGCFVAEVDPHELGHLRREFPGDLAVVGVVTAEPAIRFGDQPSIPLDALIAAWHPH